MAHLIKRIILPLSSAPSKIPQDQQALITISSQVETFYPDKLLIRNASDWEIVDFRLGSESLMPKDVASLPGEHFGYDRVGSIAQLLPKGAPPIVVRAGQDLALLVRRREEKSDDGVIQIQRRRRRRASSGSYFDACMYGTTRPVYSAEDLQIPAESPHLESSERVNLRANGVLVNSNTSIAVTFDKADEGWGDGFYLEQIAFPTLDLREWIVNDVKVGERSLIAQDGDMPAALFAKNKIRMGHLRREEKLRVAATYVGEGQAKFCCEVSGPRHERDLVTVNYFVILVTYVGLEKKGAPFVCGVIGEAASSVRPLTRGVDEGSRAGVPA